MKMTTVDTEIKDLMYEVGLQLMVLPNGELSKEESTFHQLSVRS
jgi:hypothetical protein